MATTYRLPEDFPTLHSAIKELLGGASSWKSRGALIGLSAGFSAPIIGSLVTIISWFRDPAWHGFALHQAATALFVMALPLLVFGAHCLDLLDKDKRQLAEFRGDQEQA
jgi:hypothetical protein